MSESASVVEGGSRPGRARLVLWGLLAVALLVAARAFDAPALLLRSALDGIAGLGPWGPLLFVLLYVLATVLFLPGWILTLGAGAVFGVLKGVVIVSSRPPSAPPRPSWSGATWRATGWRSRIEGNPRFRALDEAVAREGWKIVALMRLSPAFPFNLLNYAFGVTRVSLRDYVLASWIGMLPGTLMYVYLGSRGGHASRARRAPASGRRRSGPSTASGSSPPSR